VGVPGLDGGLELLLPPQATKAAASKAKTSKPKASFTRRFPAGISKRRILANRAPALGISHCGRLNRRNAVDGAVVDTVSRLEPPGAEKEVGTSEQLL
jgi:hypothetical protein